MEARAVVGMIGGVAGLLTLAVFQTPMLALLQLLCFAIWGIATGILLLRGKEAKEADSKYAVP